MPAMVEINDIQDKDSFQRWLDALPKARRRSVSIRLAFRAAARVAPIYWDWQCRDGDLTDQSIFRALATNAVAAVLSTEPIANAAARAAQAIYFAASAATTDADADAISLASSSAAAAISPHAAATMWSAVRADARVFKHQDPANDPPLWPASPPDEIAAAWNTARARLRDEPGYAWWVRWYDGLLRGGPRDWAGKLYQIATIDDDIWQHGPLAVAARIDEIEAEVTPIFDPKPANTDSVKGPEFGLFAGV